MVRKLALGLVACALVAGCKSKQTQSNDNIETAPTGQSTAIDSAPLSFDPMGSDSGKIDGLVTVHFGYDKSNLDAEAKKDIAKNADWMKKNANVKVQIEGHCDARGTIEYNVALGERRANAVKAYMVSLGIPESRLSTISYGKEKPIATGDSAEAYAKNRRANFVPAQ
ncbi:MAG TPA: peptidoglycan-associated lipoprotein Pal [Bdellovibrio sp.]|uniref:peptidoglycan-associated lipoprotein Pal n=1 Tax=Bdellovibrio sp. TaxID=28201 RepID=UPI002F17D8B4